MLTLPVSLSTFLGQSFVALTAAKKDDNVKTLLADFNFTETDIDNGLLMHTEITGLNNLQKKLHEDQYQAGRQFRELYDAAFKSFADICKLTSIAFDNESNELLKLCKAVKKQKKILAWLASAKHFYSRAIEEIQSTESDHVLLRYSTVGITKEKLETGLEPVNVALNAKSEHLKCKGEAEEKIRERDVETMLFYRFMRRLVNIALIAFKDKPQYMEKLGIIKLSDGYKRKVSEEKKNAKARSAVPAENPANQNTAQTTA